MVLDAVQLRIGAMLGWAKQRRLLAEYASSMKVKE
jgi:hypothetical protein